MLVHVRDGKIFKVEPDPDNRLSRGFSCERPRYAIKWLYHPDQLKHPLKRVGKRGDGKWQKIPWEQAIGEIAEKLKK